MSIRTPGQTSFDVSGDETPPPPTDFTPPPQLADPLPGDPRVFGAAYLEALGARISPRWASFLEDLRVRLPPFHQLNAKTLSTRVSFVISSEGAIEDLAVTKASGVADYDAAVREVLLDAAPLPPPPDDVLGDDGVARVRWLFARDYRQAGVATAALAPVRWPLARSVPMLLARGDVRGAAERVARAGAGEPSSAALLDEVAAAAIRAAAVGGDASAIEALTDADVRASAAELVKLARTPGTLARPAAFEALGRVADRGVIEAARTAIGSLETPEDVVRAAASAWLASDDGARAELEAGVTELLASQEPSRRRRAFIIGSAVPLSVLERDAEALAQNTDALELAAGVLARLAQAGDRSAGKLVRRELTSKVAARRAIVAASLAALGEPLPRTLRSSLERGIVDADERVRAASVTAVATSWPERLSRAASRLRSESSPLVLTALAHALAAQSSKRATRDLVRLLESTDASVRATAARGLWGRPNAPATLASHAADSDERIARAALPGRSLGPLRELAEQGGSLAADALAAALSIKLDAPLCARVLADGDGELVLRASLAWLAARKRARLEG